LNFLEDTAKGAQHPSLLDPCLLWPRSPISANAELLLPYITVSSSLSKTVRLKRRIPSTQNTTQ